MINAKYIILINNKPLMGEKTLKKAMKTTEELKMMKPKWKIECAEIVDNQWRILWEEKLDENNLQT